MFKRPSHKRCRAAFTLVELLVVIGIIALLISILLPALSKARIQANKVACQSNLHDIGLAISIYESEQNGWLPAGMTGNSAAADTHWDATLQQIMGRKGAINNGLTATNGGSSSGAGMIGQAFLCPARVLDQNITGTGAIYECDYSAHPRLMPRVGIDTDAAFTPPLRPARYMAQVKGAQVKRSADIILVADGVQIAPATGGGSQSGTYAANGSAEECFVAADDNAYGLSKFGMAMTPAAQAASAYIGSQVAVVSETDPCYNTSAYPEQLGQFSWRHGGDCNCLFVDGHTGSFHATTSLYPGAALDTGGAPSSLPSARTDMMRSNIWVNWIVTDNTTISQ